MHFSFEPEFQKHILASFLEKDLAEGEACLKEEYFEDEIIGDVAETIREFYHRSREAPTKEALLHEIKSRGLAPGRKRSEYIELIADIYSKIGENGQYYRDKAKDFAYSRALAASLNESKRLLETGNTEDSIREIQRAIQGNGYFKDVVHDYFEEIDARARTYFEKNKGIGSEGRIPTGFSLIDDRIQSGLGAGETGVIVGLAGRGKTTMQVSLAAQALYRKIKVLYITLELSEKIISAKFDCNICGFTLDEIKKKPKTFRDKMLAVREELRGSASLHIAEFPTKGLSLYKLQDLIEKNRPQIVFVDYASLLRASRSKDERRHELTDLHEGLRGVAGACKLPIWTAHQANRPSIGKREIGMENVAEDFNIMAVCDVAMSINQTDDERRMGTLRLYIMKNRLGASEDVIECNSNWALSRVTPATE